MKHIKAIAVKFVMIFAVLFIVLGVLFGMSFGDVLTISFIFTGILYVGDLVVLPLVNNTVATIADFGLAFFGLWILTNMAVENPYFPVISASLIAAAGITIGEMFFHRYLERLKYGVVEEEKRPQPALREKYSMETSEEFEDNKE